MKTTFNLVQDLLSAMNARERSLKSPKHQRQENPCAWVAVMLEAQQHICYESERELLDKLVSAMEMQDHRERGEFHLTPEAAWSIWKEAKLAGEAYVIDASARRFGHSGLGERMAQQASSLTAVAVENRLMGVARSSGVTASATELRSDADVVGFLNRNDEVMLVLTDGPEPAADEPAPSDNAKSAMPVGEGFLKQRAETLGRALRRFGVELKHGQALTVVAQLEGHTSFQSLKAAVSRQAPCFCPHCGAAGTLEPVGSVFCEQGEFDGKSYETEWDGSQYACTRCNKQFID